jgi:hypothetical protein
MNVVCLVCFTSAYIIDLFCKSKKEGVVGKNINKNSDFFGMFHLRPFFVFIFDMKQNRWQKLSIRSWLQKCLWKNLSNNSLCRYCCMLIFICFLFTWKRLPTCFPISFNFSFIDIQLIQSTRMFIYARMLSLLITHKHTHKHTCSDFVLWLKKKIKNSRKQKMMIWIWNKFRKINK